MRAVTLEWRQESKLLLVSDYPAADQILMIHSACRALELSLPVGAFEIRGTAEEWLLAHHPQLGRLHADRPVRGCGRGCDAATRGDPTMRLRAEAFVAAALVLAATPAIAQPINLLLPATAPRASDTNHANTRSAIASRLPTPPVPLSAPPDALLTAARQAAVMGRAGEAQEALERAETRLLNRSITPGQAGTPDDARAVLDIGVARRALAARDRSGALQAVDDALAATMVAAQMPESLTPSPPQIAEAPLLQATIPYAPPQQPMITYALLPGHWQLGGARYVWVPPETVPRRVAYRPFIRGQYVWRGGRWRWEPGHYWE